MIHKYHTLERSNYFAVEDVDAFIGEMDIAKIKWWKHKKAKHKIAISGSPERGGSFPVMIQRPKQKEPEEFCIRETVRSHLLWGDTAVLVGIMSEGYRYIDGWACVITRKYEPISMTLSEWINKTLNKMELEAFDFIN